MRARRAETPERAGQQPYRCPRRAEGARRRWQQLYRCLRRAQPDPERSGGHAQPAVAFSSPAGSAAGTETVTLPRRTEEPCAESLDTSVSNRSRPLLIQGLKRLEYRGYDSAGIVVSKNGHLEVRKEAGKIAELEKLIAGGARGGVVRHRAHALGHARPAQHAATPTRTCRRRATSRWCTTASSRTPAPCERCCRSAATSSPATPTPRCWCT